MGHGLATRIPVMLIKYGTKAALAGVLGLCIASPSYAAVIVSALSSLPVDQAVSISTYAAGELFTANSTMLRDVEVELSTTGTTSGSIVVTIRNFVSNKLGTVVDTIATLSETVIPKTETLFDFYNISLATHLTIGNAYYISVGKAPGSAAISTSIYTTAALPSTGTLGTSAGTGNNGSFTDYAIGPTAGITTKFMAVCVSDDLACRNAMPATLAYSFNEVPEPATVGILGAGLAGLGYLRRRHARSA
jgi:hypothetical protein